MYFSRILAKSLWRSVASRRIDDQSPAKAQSDQRQGPPVSRQRTRLDSPLYYRPIGRIKTSEHQVHVD